VRDFTGRLTSLAALCGANCIKTARSSDASKFGVESFSLRRAASTCAADGSVYTSSRSGPNAAASMSRAKGSYARRSSRLVLCVHGLQFCVTTCAKQRNKLLHGNSCVRRAHDHLQHSAEVFCAPPFLLVMMFCGSTPRSRKPVRSAAMTASSCALVGAGSITLILGRLLVAASARFVLS
jgi:hypothetical protein